MKVLILDSYPKTPHRISKDTIGGYGTANRFGDGLVAGLLTRLMAKEVDWPPIYSAYTAGVLRDAGHEVDYSRDWRRAQGCDLVLLTSSIVCHETEVECVRRIAETGVAVGMIGPFAGSVPQPYLDAGAFVIAGEPEMYFMRNAVDADVARRLAGVVPEAEPVELDDLPLPAWDLIFDVAPPRFGLLSGGEIMLPLHATRGCPYSCFNYCTYPLQQGRTVRTRAPDKIVEEMIHWQDRLGVTIFIFRDPVFSIDRKHTLALCDALERCGRRFRLIVETHLRNLDEEIAVRLRDVGLEMVKVGIESINPEALKSSKRFTIAVDEQTKRIAMLERLGVKITCFYMLGMPGDSPQQFETTMRYARELNALFAQISVFTPYPGTPAFVNYEDKITAGRYEDFTQYDLIYRHETLTAPQVRRLLSRAYRDYYARPRWLKKYLSARLSRFARARGRRIEATRPISNPVA